MIKIDAARYEVTVKGKEVALTLKEFSMLKLMKDVDGAVVTRRKFLNDCWGANFVDWDSRIIDQNIARIRRKLKKVKADHLIVSVTGVGYKLKRA